MLNLGLPSDGLIAEALEIPRTELIIMGYQLVVVAISTAGRGGIESLVTPHWKQTLSCATPN